MRCLIHEKERHKCATPNQHLEWVKRYIVILIKSSIDFYDMKFSCSGHDYIHSIVADFSFHNLGGGWGLVLGFPFLLLSSNPLELNYFSVNASPFLIHPSFLSAEWRYGSGARLLAKISNLSISKLHISSLARPVLSLCHHSLYHHILNPH